MSIKYNYNLDGVVVIRYGRVVLAFKTELTMKGLYNAFSQSPQM